MSFPRIAPGNTAFTPLTYYDYPISHSLLAAVGWAFNWPGFAGVGHPCDDRGCWTNRLGHIDDLIDPRETRNVLDRTLQFTHHKRPQRSRRKHGVMPV